MKNSFSSSNLNLIRTRPQSADWWLAIHRPRVMGEFTITNHSNYAGSLIAELGVLGTNQSSALADQTGVVYDTNGNWMGDIRIRKDWPGNGNVISIAEAGSGLIDWQSSSTMKVIDQYRPWLKHPRYNSATSQWMMDFDVTYAGQMSQWGPYANPGTPIIALPASSGKWVVDFVGSDSFSLQTSITSASWVFPDGQVVTSGLGTETSPIKMTFTGASPGGSYFSLTVVDTNAGSHTGRRLIFAVNDISQFPAVQVSTISGGIESGGYQAQFMAVGNPVSQITETNYPHLDNSELIVFEKARYGGTRASFGGNVPLRGDTIFRGWVSGREMRVSPFSSDMMITAETVNGIANQGDSYDVFLANYQSGASAWTEISSLKLDSVTQFMLKWRSTLGVICDWTPMGGLGNSEEIFYQSLPRSGLFDQIKSNYYDRGVLGYFASDMQSNLFAFQDMQLAGSSTNGSVALLHQDKRDSVTISSPPRDENAQVKLYAVASDIPYGAESPAHVRGYFGGERVQEKGLLVDSQQSLITWSGNLRAKLNNRYPRINVPLSNNMRIDPIPQSIVTMSMAASENTRGIVWNSDKFVTKELNVAYDATVGYPLFDLGFEKYTQGIGGSSITFPTIEDIVAIPTVPPPPGSIPIPSVPPGTGFGTGFGTVYVLVDSVLWRTRDFSASPPVWTVVGPTISTLNDFILDPWNPAVNGFLLGNDGVYRSTNLDTASPTWDHVIDNTAIQALYSAPSTITGFTKIVGSINYRGFLAFVGYYVATGGGGVPGGLVLFKSVDSGDTWTGSLIANPAFRSYLGATIDIVPHVVSGELVLYAHHAAQGGNDMYLYRSVNSGATWTQIANKPATGSNEAHLIHCPYEGNDDGMTVFWGQTAANSTPYLFKTVNTTTTDLSPTTPAVAGNGLLKRWGAETYTENGQVAYHWYDNVLYSSGDGGDSWSTVSKTGLPGTFSEKSSGGFPNNSSLFYLVADTATNIGVYVSSDRGQTWVTKTGNLLQPNGVYYRTVIVPLWTE